jgi:4-oxalocrotonate tautomerase
MPIITLRMNKMPSSRAKTDLVEGLSLITENILRKNRKVIVVRFDVDDRQDGQWYVNTALPKGEEVIFELSIAITRGTNTDKEKADWIAEAWRLVSGAVENSPYPNYISINEIDGNNWGYNGLTQDYRRNTK